MSFFEPHSLYKEHNNITEDCLEEQFFTISGLEEFLYNGVPRRQQNDQHVYAKRIQKKDGTYKLSIKTGSNGKLYNPISIYGEDTKSTLLDSVCKSNDKFKTVNNKTFEWYLKFLSTKNLAWLYNAEREAE